jgi:hypothetical protein
MAAHHSPQGIHPRPMLALKASTGYHQSPAGREEGDTEGDNSSSKAAAKRTRVLRVDLSGCKYELCKSQQHIPSSMQTQSCPITQHHLLLPSLLLHHPATRIPLTLGACSTHQGSHPFCCPCLPPGTLSLDPLPCCPAPSLLPCLLICFALSPVSLSLLPLLPCSAHRGPPPGLAAGGSGPGP